MANQPYSSITKVTAFIRHLLDGQSTLNSTPRPTATEAQEFLRRSTALLNTALAGEGLTVPITQSDALLTCEDWVTQQTARFCELTQRGAGFNDTEGSRTAAFPTPYKDAQAFAKAYRLAFINLGVTVANGQAKSAGLQYTGTTAQEDRTDRGDSSLEQPLFERHMFDTAGPSTPDTSEDDDQ